MWSNHFHFQQHMVYTMSSFNIKFPTTILKRLHHLFTNYPVNFFALQVKCEATFPVSKAVFAKMTKLKTRKRRRHAFLNQFKTRAWLWKTLYCLFLPPHSRSACNDCDCGDWVERQIVGWFNNIWCSTGTCIRTIWDLKLSEFGFDQIVILKNCYNFNNWYLGYLKFARN